MKVVTLPAIAILLMRKEVYQTYAYPGFESSKRGSISQPIPAIAQADLSNAVALTVEREEQRDFEGEHPVRTLPFTQIGLPPTQKCPENFTRVGDICRREISLPGVKKCSWKTYLDGDYCNEIETVESQEMCPEGYFVKGAKCAKPEVRTADVVCADGYAKGNGVCIRFSEDELIQECPKGYKFSVRGCLRKTIFPAELSCPMGHDLVHGKCHVFEQWTPDLRCSSGYSLKDGVCVQVLTRQPKFSCPKGYKSEGNLCTTYSSVESDLLCTAGTLSKKKCVVETNVSPVSECPSGFAILSGSCIRTTSEPPKMECETFGFRPAGDRCVRELITKPDLVCPPGSHLFKDKCQQIVKDLASATCPSGFTFTDGECAKHEIGEAQYSCPFGYKLDNMNTCTKDRKTRPTYTCPEGELRGRDCNKKEIADFIRPCSPDKKGSSCERLTISPRLVCPKNSTMDTTGRCASQMKVSSIPACPPGTIPNGKMCEKSSAAPPRITCPVGFHEEAQQCAKYETTTPSKQCPERMILKRNMCVSV